jgi:hypothetical protein
MVNVQRDIDQVRLGLASGFAAGSANPEGERPEPDLAC